MANPVQVYGNSFIEIETDYEFVKGQIEDRAARFLMDFTNVEGPLRRQMAEIGAALEDSAKDFLEQQGIGRDTNLAKGIHAIVRKTSIELRSSAYKLPRTAPEGGTRPRKRKAHGNLRENGDLVGFNRYPWRKGAYQKEATQMISPQGADLIGATGGTHSLQPWHIKRYNRNGGNIQYYGGHVEFGHRTRNDGGIGFVQARPHLRPALRVVADESRQMLSTTMAFMLQGLGNEFETRNINGQRITGLTFGSKFNTLYDKTKGKESGSRFASLHHAISNIDTKGLRDVYSVRRVTDKYYRETRNPRYFYENRSRIRNIGFGKDINYSKYGYTDRIRKNARLAQQKREVKSSSGLTSLETVNLSKHYSSQERFTKRQSPWRGIAPKDRAYVKQQYNSRMIGRKFTVMKAKSTASTNKKNINTKNNNTNKGRGKNNKGGSKRNGKSGNKRNGKGGSKKNNSGKRFNKTENLTYGGKKGPRQVEPNNGGADPLRQTRPEDFMVTVKPSQVIAQEVGMDIRAYEQWQEDYREEKANAERLSEVHNKRLLWLKEHGDF